MQNDELLDTTALPEKESDHKSIITWWERKRIIYNLVIVFVELTITLIEWKGALRWGLSDVVIGSAVYLFIANGFYTAGWAIEFLINHYFSRFKLNINLRWLFLILGFLFSIFLTILIFSSWLNVEEI